MKEILNPYFHEADSTTVDGLNQWIKGTLSHPQSSLNNLAPCPYAKEALIKNEIQIFSTDQSPEQALIQLIESFDSFNKRVIVLTCSTSALTTEEATKLVNIFREQMKGKDLWLMYDHPGIPEHVAGINFNYGQKILFFLQKLTDLSQAAQQLMDKGYYKNWPQDYFETVFSTRHRSFKEQQN